MFVGDVDGFVRVVAHDCREIHVGGFRWVCDVGVRRGGFVCRRGLAGGGGGYPCEACAAAGPFLRRVVGFICVLSRVARCCIVSRRVRCAVRGLCVVLSEWGLTGCVAGVAGDGCA